jgi:hypothetical protein
MQIAAHQAISSAGDALQIKVCDCSNNFPTLSASSAGLKRGKRTGKVFVFFGL